MLTLRGHARVNGKDGPYFQTEIESGNDILYGFVGKRCERGSCTYDIRKYRGQSPHRNGIL